MRIMMATILALALAGCMDPEAIDDAGSQPVPGIAPQEGHAEDTQGDLHLSAVLSTCDAGFCINATASNEGSDPAYVSNICQPPHHDSMARDGESVQPREPRYYCQAFGLGAWEPNEQIEFGYEWDGRLWDDDQGKMVEAPQGAYQWSIHFRAYDSESGGDHTDLSVTFTVVIGPT